MTGRGAAAGPALRVALVGQSGSGKSTCAGFIAAYARDNGLTYSVLKLAKPLYDLQSHIYATAGAPLAEGVQDQQLMESLATALRRIRPGYLAEDFLGRLSRLDADVVVNDDLRDPHVDAPALRAQGFRILRVTAPERLRGQRRAARGDLTRADGSTREIDLIEADAVVENTGTVAACRTAVHALLEEWR